jgi:hypothetical protein
MSIIMPWLKTIMFVDSRGPPKRCAGGADQTATRITPEPQVLPQGPERNNQFRLALTALSAEELLEWLQTERGWLAFAVLEANRSLSEKLTKRNAP